MSTADQSSTNIQDNQGSSENVCLIALPVLSFITVAVVVILLITCCLQLSRCNKNSGTVVGELHVQRQY